MSVLELGRADGPVDMVFLHANGFNATTYHPLLAPLAEGRRIWAIDQRGHGLTDLPADPEGRRGWQDLRGDLLAVIDALEGRPVLAGHSMGGTVSLLAAAKRPERVRGLVLLDPVIWLPLTTLAFNLPGMSRFAGRIPLVRNSRKRRADFPDLEAARKAYRGRGAFAGWPDDVLDAFLETGLKPSGDALTLTCRPDWEASGYAAQGHNPWGAMFRFRGPVRILRAETGSTCHVPDRPPGLFHVRSRRVPGATHFLPMLSPDAVREALVVALDTDGVASPGSAR
jgi:pimeloyl-ACP methyl ester carboxylesterase